MSVYPVDKALKDGFVAFVKVYIDPSKVDEFWKAAEPVRDSIVAEKENVFFIVAVDDSTAAAAQSNGDPPYVTITITEGWSKSVEWFMQNQFTREYYKPYLAATEAMFVKPREFNVAKIPPGMATFKTS